MLDIGAKATFTHGNLGILSKGLQQALLLALSLLLNDLHRILCSASQRIHSLREAVVLPRMLDERTEATDSDTHRLPLVLSELFRKVK